MGELPPILLWPHPSSSPASRAKSEETMDEQDTDLSPCPNAYYRYHTACALFVFFCGPQVGSVLVVVKVVTNTRLVALVINSQRARVDKNGQYLSRVYKLEKGRRKIEMVIDQESPFKELDLKNRRGGGELEDDSRCPRWLRPLLTTRFFIQCNLHADSHKSDCNMYCLDCTNGALCSLCLAHHRGHRTTQVRSFSCHQNRGFFADSIGWVYLFLLANEGGSFPERSFRSRCYLELPTINRCC
ncbi:PLATZ transcription factor [Musa troglodytarum]|uniref:PLATZ transcription factor n=1 Tax=Musa troglodytarum TaxID=320322 RepID=A0A9E7JGK5_9LILI|nr:PLATZ transcription factor [Musa troglodytarum]